MKERELFTNTITILTLIIAHLSFSLSVNAMEVPNNYINPAQNSEISEYTVRVMNGRSGSSCTASWISERSLLTAAHCRDSFLGKESNVVTIQQFINGKPFNGGSFNVDKSKVTFAKHPKYGEKTFFKKPDFNYDLAVVTIDKSVNIPAHKSVILAPVDLVELNGDFLYTGAGGMDPLTFWDMLTKNHLDKLVSLTKDPNIANGVPHKFILELVTQNFFTLHGLNTFTTPNVQISKEMMGLVSNTPETILVCTGDSGGPLFKSTDDKTIVQIGVHSRASRDGNKNCGSRAFDTLINSNNIVWISEKMNELEGITEFTGVKVYGAYWVSFHVGDILINGLKLPEEQIK